MKKPPLEAGVVCLLPGMDDEQDRVVLLLSDVTTDGAMVLVLDGRVATKEPGEIYRIKGLLRLLRPL